MIHPTASIDPSARLDDGVVVGPWSVIGAEVGIGAGTRIDSHVVVTGPTRIGRDNRFHPFSSIGGDPQDKKFAGETSLLEIGDGNVVREYCTLNRGTGHGGGVTRIGDGNWIMAYCHVAHDCMVGSSVVMANGSTLAGHVSVGDHVTLGAFTVVHQFCKVGAHAFTAMGTVVLKDVPPFVTVSGNSAAAHGLNTEGLRRRGFSPEAIRALRRAYKVLYRQALTVEQAVAQLVENEKDSPEVMAMVEFVRAATRGIVR